MHFTTSSTMALRVFRTEDARRRYLALYDATLRHWPVPYEEIEAPTRFGKTHAIVSGAADAPSLVLLPAMMMPALMWRANIAALSRCFRTYAIDVIGEPNKSAPIRRIKNRREFGDWFVDLLNTLGIERTSIVGNSFGGFLALNQASLTPERIDRVVLISPAATFARITWKFYYYVLLPSMLGIKELRSRGKVWMQNGVPTNPIDTGLGAMVDLVASEGRPANMVFPRVLRKAEVGRIRIPALLLIGDKERIYEPYSTLKRALDRMPGLEAEIVPNANHLASMSQSGWVNERIIRFLQGRIAD